MTEQELSVIAMKIANDTKFWIAAIGLVGAIVGSFFTILGNFALEMFKNRKQDKIDKLRENILVEMLREPAYQWRNLSTLSAVIGCEESETKKHLISIKARGSETSSAKWGLISRHPLKDIR